MKNNCEKRGFKNIIDLHTHLFPQKLFLRIWKYFEEHYWPVIYQWEEEKRAEFLEERTCYYTTLCYAHKKGIAEDLNNYVLEYSKRYIKVIPVGTFHPEDENLYKYVEEGIEKGLRGFKVHIEVQNFNPADKRLKEVYKMINEGQCVLHIHSAPMPGASSWTGIEHFKNMLKIAPYIKIIVAHLAAPCFEEYFELAKHHPIYFDTAMVDNKYITAFKIPEKWKEIIAEHPEKIVFGSDFPNISYDWKHQVEVIEEWGLGESSLEKIFFKNAIGIYELPDSDLEQSEFGKLRK